MTFKAKSSGFKLAASEEDLSQFVKDYSGRAGWRRIHFRPAQKADGTWVTPIEGEPGYPDWTMVRGPRLVIAELKSQKGRYRDGQEAWLDALGLVPGVETYTWRPSDIPEIRRILR